MILESARAKLAKDDAETTVSTIHALLSFETSAAIRVPRHMNYSCISTTRFTDVNTVTRCVLTNPLHTGDALNLMSAHVYVAKFSIDHKRGSQSVYAVRGARNPDELAADAQHVARFDAPRSSPAFGTYRPTGSLRDRIFEIVNSIRNRPYSLE